MTEKLLLEPRNLIGLNQSNTQFKTLHRHDFVQEHQGDLPEQSQANRTSALPVAQVQRGISCKSEVPLRALVYWEFPGHCVLDHWSFSSRIASVLFVGCDDALHQWMSHDISPAKFHHANALDLPQRMLRFDQPRLLVRGEIDLSDVAGDHRPGIKPKPGQKHEHLFGSRVLGFVQDDKRVVEGRSEE